MCYKMVYEKNCYNILQAIGQECVIIMVYEKNCYNILQAIGQECVIKCYMKKNYYILQVTGHETFTFIFCKHCWDSKNIRRFLTLIGSQWRPDDDPTGSKHVASLIVINE
jgi:hypothetical protein